MALTECLFEHGGRDESFQILDSFLEYIFAKKLLVWIKSNELKGLMWDLVSTAVRCFSNQHIVKLDDRPTTKDNLVKMYQTTLDSIFLRNNKDFYASNVEINPTRQTIH